MYDINLNNIKDEDVRVALTAIKEMLMNDLPILRGEWTYFEVETPHGGNFSEVHNLGFTPKDFIITYDTAEISINYTKSTNKVFVFDAVTDGIVRGFYGKYEDEVIV